MTLRSGRGFLVGVAFAAALALGPAPARAQDSAPAAAAAAPSSSAAPTAAPQTADQLDALVAPIALYPDALVAQVLAAATFPDQIAVASYWLTQNQTLTGASLAQAVDQQSWDASVKALTQFPAVLQNMAQNLVWTSDLGQAFHDQQADVMAAVQTMRAKAQAAGTLQSTPQAQVVQQSPQTIVIQPANPKVVYVPQYNPTVVYGAPTVVPFYTPPVVVAGPVVSFGAGFAIGGGGWGGFGWGWGAWGCAWGGGGGGGGTVIYNHNTYISNRSWHNTYNNYHPWGPGPHGQGPYGPHPYGPNGWNHQEPNGGRNGDHGLIGGKGGTQHPPDGGRNGDGGLIGGPGGTQHAEGGGSGDASHVGFQGRGPGYNPAQRNMMSGNGNAARAEANRGRSSMQPQHRPQQQRRPPQHRPQQARPHPQAHPAPRGHRG